MVNRHSESITKTKPSSRGSSSKREKKTKETKDEEQRIRNIDSAKRSRERLRLEDKWMQVQALETADRIGRLEKQVSDLYSDIASGSGKNRKSSIESREEKPSWFGDAF